MSPRLDIPTLRKRVWSLHRSLRPLLFEMLRRKVFLRGSVYELHTRCGKPNCVCTRGKLHRRWGFSESREGRKRLRVGPRGEAVRRADEVSRLGAEAGEVSRRAVEAFPRAAEAPEAVEAFPRPPRLPGPDSIMCLI